MKKSVICLYFLFLFAIHMQANEETGEDNKFIAFFKDKDNIGFIILISIAFVGFSFKLVDVIIRSRREKRELQDTNRHSHHHHHHYHHHPHGHHHSHKHSKK